jgi:hypothetical protein
MLLYRKYIFYALNATAIIAAVLPYFWTRFFGYEVNDIFVKFVCAVAWLACFILVLWMQRWRWLPCTLILVAAPFACFPAAKTLFVLLLWSINGFAP